MGDIAASRALQSENAPRWDLTGTEGCGGGKWFRGSPGCLQGIRVYIGERSRSVESRGAHEGGGTPTPLGAPQGESYTHPTLPGVGVGEREGGERGKERGAPPPERTCGAPMFGFGN
mgnify:CR=1 FL=1